MAQREYHERAKWVGDRKQTDILPGEERDGPAIDGNVLRSREEDCECEGTDKQNHLRFGHRRPLRDVDDRVVVRVCCRRYCEFIPAK